MVSRRREGKGARPSGFTLLELIVVCFLIGLLLTLAVPTLRTSLFTDQLRTGARQAIGLLTETRQRAVREQTPYLLQFQREEGTIMARKAEAQGDQDEETAAASLTLPAGVAIEKLWRRHATGDGEQLTLWVSRQGYVDEAVLQLAGDDGETISLVLSPYQPAVAIKDGAYEPD